MRSTDDLLEAQRYTGPEMSVQRALCRAILLVVASTFASESIEGQVGKPHHSSMNNDERAMTEAACRPDQHFNGPAAYYRCLARQLASLGHGHKVTSETSH